MSAPAWPATEPIEVRITAGDAALVVDLRGGGPRELTVGDRHVLDGYPAGTVPSGRKGGVLIPWPNRVREDRKSTRLNSSHANISYAVFCLKKKTHIQISVAL